MRTLYLGILLSCAGLSLQAQEQAKKVEKAAPRGVAPKNAAAPTLKVGDNAPPLNVTKWLQGKELKSLEKGQVHVVEFWATWCGPCIVMMPHLGELQREYQSKGVNIIGFTAVDPNNSKEKVEEFVGKRGPKLGYTFAFADNRDTYSSWMTAAGRNGIPCTFVVNKEGKIAYIGHPMYLDLVLPKVVEGTWDPEKDNTLLKEVEKEVNSVFQAISKTGQAAEGLKAIADFQSKYPALSKIPYFVSPKIGLLLGQDKKSEARDFAKKVIEEASKCEDSSMLQGVAGQLIGPLAKKDPELAKLALEASEKVVQISGDSDIGGQILSARVKFATGDKVAAKKHAQKALELAPDRLKPIYQNSLKEILGETSNQ